MKVFIVEKYGGEYEDSWEYVDKVFDDVCTCCDLFIDDKFNMAMNKYNRKN
jgi:hypothetical protein